MEKYYRTIDILFVMLISTLIFTVIPKTISFEPFGGVMGSKLSIYPLLLGILITIKTVGENKENDSNFDNFNKIVLKFAVCLFCVNFISLFWGIINYPYINSILGDPKFIPKGILKIFNFLGYDYHAISQNTIKVWVGIKGVKNILANIIWQYGCAYFIYFWYKNRMQDCFNLLLKGILIGTFFIFLYELIELPYLLGSDSAKNILVIINPYIHRIGRLTNFYNATSSQDYNWYSWWPRLLWPNQVRSVFAEPSFLGLHCAFSIPWTWYRIWKIKDEKKNLKKNDTWIWWSTCLFLTFLVFLTRSRTALLLYLFQMGLLFLYCLVKKTKCDFRKLAFLMTFSILMFFSSLIFINLSHNKILSQSATRGVHNQTDTQLMKSSAIDNYVSENVSSAFSKKQRSNLARLSLMAAELKVWLEHPALGVGMGMRAAYIPEKFSREAFESNEVRMWVNRLKDNGPLIASFPNVSEYTSKLCELGLLGVVAYYSPVVYLLISFAKVIKDSICSKNNNYLIDFKYNFLIFYLIQLLGFLVSGITTSLDVSFCFWVLIGIGLIIKHNILID